MDGGELLRTSRRERELYAALAAAYRDLAATLADDVDAVGIAAHRARAEEITAALRAAAAALAPSRLGGEPVPGEVQAVWRASAALAAEAAEANAALAALARARQAALAHRLAEVRAGRRGLAGYRPHGDPRAALADHRA
jgi:hypothetical protein